MKQINLIVYSCKYCMFFREDINGKYCYKLQKYLPIKLHQNVIYDGCELMDYKP